MLIGEAGGRRRTSVSPNANCFNSKVFLREKGFLSLPARERYFIEEVINLN